MFINWTDAQKGHVRDRYYLRVCNLITAPSYASQRGRGSDSRPDGSYGLGNLNPFERFLTRIFQVSY